MIKNHYFKLFLFFRIFDWCESKLRDANYKPASIGVDEAKRIFADKKWSMTKKPLRTERQSGFFINIEINKLGA